ncbi:gas vesicle protein GvpO, halophile-type [Halomicrococcus sp. NG-SE-24]|uniref:gas vesicle protein GvpO, halophile-type n=1 Tax=Halomicrococcus sp. NG-SE-24 TaxID=3436928 RepID=UPI003D954E74
MAEVADEQATGDQEQCRALTADGERCSNAAGEDGFCHLHGPDDETIDDGLYDDVLEESSTADEDDADDAESGSPSSETEDDFGVMAVRDRVETAANELLREPLDRIIEITADEDGWQVFVEVVERSAVPDTQDILGQYSITVDESGTITGYRLSERYRRGDDREH